MESLGFERNDPAKISSSELKTENVSNANLSECVEMAFCREIFNYLSGTGIFFWTFRIIVLKSAILPSLLRRLDPRPSSEYLRPWLSVYLSDFYGIGLVVCVESYSCFNQKSGVI